MRTGQELELTLGERSFKIKKFNPQTACYWAFRLLGDLAFTSGEEFIEQLRKFMRTMDKKEFTELRKDCLVAVIADLESGPHSLIDTMGNFVIPNLSNDDSFQLMMAAFTFSMRDFFGEARMQPIIDDLLGMFLQTGITNSSGDPSS